MAQNGEWGGEGTPLPTSPSGRVPQWVLDEAARLSVQPGRPAPPPPPRRRIFRAFRGLAVLLLGPVLVLVAAVLVEHPLRNAPGRRGRQR